MRLVLSVLIAFGPLTPLAQAQMAQEKPVPAPATPNSHNAGHALTQPEMPKTMAGPYWQELTPAQRVSLKPLASTWNSLEAALKRKWIALAVNYPTLSPADQVKLHSRMAEWSLLSKQERARARLNFAEAKQVSPDQKAATWEAYQALSPEERKKLAASAPPKPSGAAGASKPVPPQKLATVPLSVKNQSPATPLKSPQKLVDGNTLLPLPTPVTDPVEKTE